MSFDSIQPFIPPGDGSMTTLFRLARHLVRAKAAALVAALVLGLTFAPGAFAADKVTLKDGTVLEGTIEREDEGFLFLLVKIGSLENRRLILREDIKSIERDAEATESAKAPAAGGKDESASTATASPARSTRTEQATVPAGAARVAFISLGDPPDKDMVGPFMNADALKRSIELLNEMPEETRPQIVVLKFNSGGGALFEIQKLSDVIENDIKPKYQVVAWIESAISAAAMTAYTVEDIYFMSKGNFGAATGYYMQGGKAHAVEGKDLEEVLYMMEKIAERGGHDRLVMRAMQVEQELSADIDEHGVVTWRPDLKGEHVVNPKGRILTFNSQDAVRYKLAKGVADSKEQLMSLIVGDREWVEVGQQADAYQHEFRDNVFNAQREINELANKLSLEMQAAQSARGDERLVGRHVGAARRYLGQIRSWIRKAPSLEVYQGWTPERFREVEEQIRDFQRDATRRR